MSKDHIERNSRKVIARLEAEGWTRESVTGDHYKFKHPAFRDPIVVTHPKKDMSPGVARSIAMAAGWVRSKRR